MHNLTTKSAIQIIVCIFLTIGLKSQAQSIYPFKIEDKKAVYFQSGQFKVHADGIHDDSEALQQAIDLVESNGKYGIVFIPEGRYKISKTVYVWKGIRIIGYGKTRPVLIRDGNDSEFNAADYRYIIYFANAKRRNGGVSDANASTFYSAISNVDFEFKNGNDQMVGIRSNYAQHCFISDCNFKLGTALAAIERVGNDITNCSFIDGTYGILAYKTSPGWPIVLIDSYFEGQTKAAIETQEAGLTIIRSHFKDMPSAILTRSGQPEKLFMEDCRFEEISEAAIVINEEYNSWSQFNIKNLTCIKVPFLASFSDSKKEIRIKDKIYNLTDFMHGLQIKDLGSAPGIETQYNIVPLSKIPALPLSDVPTLPAQNMWKNMADLGVVGNSEFDNTSIIQNAVDQYDVLYFPSGRYLISEKISLKPNTVLIGLNPIATQILIADKTPTFNGIGNPKPLIESSKGGGNIISGIGIDAGGINSRAVGIKWMAGENSMINDVKFMGGHGTYDSLGTYLNIYNNNRTADSDNNREWDSQYWSLWVTNGGGGTFKNIWTASPFAQAGFYVSNTTTPGRVYGMSLEHHVRNEAQFKNVSNWKLYAFQFEEEPGEGWNALPVDIENCSNLRFANLYFYRTSRTLAPFPYAVRVRNSTDLEFCNVHSYSSTRFIFDNTIFDSGFNLGIRDLEISNLRLSGNPPKHQKSNFLPEVKKIAGGFEFIDALCSDSKGNVYFTDSRWHEIYRFSPVKNEISMISDLPVSPLGLAVDKNDNLLVKCNDNAIISVDVSNYPAENFELLAKDSVMHPKEKWAVYPAYLHSSFSGFCDKLLAGKVAYYHNNDTTTTFVNTLEGREPHNLGVAVPGKKFYLVQDEVHKTYSFDVSPDGNLTNQQLFAERGDYQAIADQSGNVYIVAEQILVYNPEGILIKTIVIPERPSSIAFGGPDGNSLYITARSSLYCVELK
jgi:sugar lactone lactonase YvrE